MSRKRGRRPRSLRRPRPTRDIKKRLLILCEGDVTEPQYFKGFAHAARKNLIHVRRCTDSEPLAIVRASIEAREEAERVADRDRDPLLRYDETWCVLDVDSHARLKRAEALARAENIRLAISNPCFELWLLLHFEDWRRHCSCDDLISRLKEHVPRYDKSITYRAFEGLDAEAAARAVELCEEQLRRGRPRGNPTTSVHELTASICAT